tara:strand:- start:480 stop:1052 length:573 start_codon:yes stop_codon:yes gene_type:complete
MQSSDLDLLKSASFEDSSWKDDECPSFHRYSNYNKTNFYEIYVCYVILDGKTKGNYHVRPIITAMYNKEKALLNVDGQDYFHDVPEAIIACVKHDEDANKSAKKKENNLKEYHNLLSELSDNHTEIFDNLQKLLNVWCDIHNLEHMSADEMNPENEHQRRWLNRFSQAWVGMDDIGYLHHYAYNNAGEEL